MSSYNTIFSPADILLPKFSSVPEEMSKWAVIACDQFTSEPEYWENCRNIISDNDSAYRYIMPEAYLETDLEEKHSEIVFESMKNFSEDSFSQIAGLLYIERTLPNGKVRHGIVGKIDLEAYDYAKGSASPVRATEATVLERIPPRSKIRGEAKVELPHILILVDETTGIFSQAKIESKSIAPIYDFNLMLGGGHITAYHLQEEALESVMDKIIAYENAGNSVIYAMGDGNHSLAAAKAHWEALKAQGAEMSHPSRYALCEITALSDESLVFEPIYRIIKNCNIDDFMAKFDKIASEGDNKQNVTVLIGDLHKKYGFENPSHALTVGTLQNFIDDYIKNNPGVVCDYIHGEDSLIKLSREENTVGFLFDGMDKSELFSYVQKHGTLPRKTFSMGEAESKRYYIEMRMITK